MLAWRGKARDELLAALRQIQGGTGQDVSASRPARPRLDVPVPSLEDCLDGFWSPGLSPARFAGAGQRAGHRRPRSAAAHVPAAARPRQGKGLS
jgi:hypothetical protein